MNLTKIVNLEYESEVKENLQIPENDENNVHYACSISQKPSLSMKTMIVRWLPKHQPIMIIVTPTKVLLFFLQRNVMVVVFEPNEEVSYASVMDNALSVNEKTNISE